MATNRQQNNTQSNNANKSDLNNLISRIESNLS